MEEAGEEAGEHAAVEGGGGGLARVQVVPIKFGRGRGAHDGGQARELDHGEQLGQRVGHRADDDLAARVVDDRLADVGVVGRDRVEERVPRGVVRALVLCV